MLLKPAVGPSQYMRQVRLSIPTFDNTGAAFLFKVPGQAVALPGLPSTLDTLISIGNKSPPKVDFWRLALNSSFDFLRMLFRMTLILPSFRNMVAQFSHHVRASFI